MSGRVHARPNRSSRRKAIVRVAIPPDRFGAPTTWLSAKSNPAKPDEPDDDRRRHLHPRHSNRAPLRPRAADVPLDDGRHRHFGHPDRPLLLRFRVPGTPVRRMLLEWHKSLGMTALVLIVFRIAYRLATKTPPYAERLGRLTHLGATGAHAALYGLMLFMPLTGYWFSAEGGYSLPFFLAVSMAARAYRRQGRNPDARDAARLRRLCDLHDCRAAYRCGRLASLDPTRHDPWLGCGPAPGRQGRPATFRTRRRQAAAARPRRAVIPSSSIRPSRKSSNRA